ncbi:MAG: histidine kinase dimerization/phosphoacceptor domain -containing protein [Cyanobacteria bacterium P01_A01_bin.17]
MSGGMCNNFINLFLALNGQALQWDPALVWLHTLSEACIASAYFSILLALIYFVRQRKDLRSWVFPLSGAFALVGGLTHIMEAYSLWWYPNHWVLGVIKFLAAVISLVMAAAMIPIIPQALTLPSRAELEVAKAELEDRVLERTQALQISEERLQLALDGSGDGFWDWDISTGALFLSARWQEMLGYGANELSGEVSTWESLIHPEDKPGVMKVLEHHLQDSRVSYAFDYRVKMKSGEWKWIGNYGRVVVRDAQGAALRMAGTHKDISNRKHYEQKLSDSLDEKNIMLQEIHHRVKNNLQVICSLLSLQTQSNTDPKIIKIMQESQDRVKSMALVHENLYLSREFLSINLESYVNDLTKNLLRSYRSKRSLTKINVSVSGLHLNIDSSVLCGLIINELVSNALKHAFHQRQNGEIYIKMAEINSQDITLTVTDNGIGLPSDINIEETETIGLQMVKTLTQQMSGTLSISRCPGTSFCITFPQVLS